MTLVIKLNEERTILIDFSYNKKKWRVIATYISTNYSLIKYLLTFLDKGSISENKDGYICLKRLNGKKTSIQKLIMEFYSNYDLKLKSELSYNEIDHINNIKKDNMTTNFQILPHSENSKKIHSNEYQVTTKNDVIMKIDSNIKYLKQYKIDEEYLKRKSGKFKKVIENGIFEKISECSYLDLSSTKYNSNYNDLNSIRDSLNRDIINIINILTEKNTKLIYNMYMSKNRYIANKILNHNLVILNRFRSRYKYLDEVIKKYNILKDNNNKINADLYIYEMNYQMNLYKSKNVLLDLYQLMISTNKFTIKDSNILKKIDISFEIARKGRYTCFRILYILGLLNKEKSRDRTSFFSIPIYTEELLKEANKIAKKILDLNLKRIRYFIVVEEFGEDVAKEIYKERFSKLNNFYHKYSLRAKEDIINFLKEDKDIYLKGYITIEEIFTQIEFINENRKIKGLEYNPIYKNFSSFIKDLLKYNTDTIKVLKKLGFVYTSVNKSIINNIKKYQKESTISYNSTNELKSRNRIIVLKKLLK